MVACKLCSREAEQHKVEARFRSLHREFQAGLQGSVVRVRFKMSVFPPSVFFFFSPAFQTQSGQTAKGGNFASREYKFKRGNRNSEPFCGNRAPTKRSCELYSPEQALEYLEGLGSAVGRSPPACCFRGVLEAGAGRVFQSSRPRGVRSLRWLLMQLSA